MIKTTLQILLIILSVSCSSQESNTIRTENVQNKTEEDLQIGEYVVATFEDSKGNLWFGTLAKGVAKFDGNELKYLTTKDGLSSNRVTSIIEDKDGYLWFGTEQGLDKYDGETFLNFDEEDGLSNNSISNLLMDSKNNFWVGTWGGVCKFDGKNFTNLNLPYPSVEAVPNDYTKNWITSIVEDSKGNIWFGRDGYGACKYDGKTFTNYTKKDGLNSDNVQSISEDDKGNIWIGTRVAEKDKANPDERFGNGGLNKFDGVKFTQFLEVKELNNNDVYEIYTDNLNNIWISTIRSGAFKYKDGKFENIKVPKPIVSMLKDKKGNMWFGCAGGLYRLNANGLENITVNGPWK